jgi:predicted N-acetyltransferase YhbS
MPLIRPARRADLPRIFELLDVAFEDTPVQLFVDQTERDSTMRLRHMRLAVHDSQIFSHVRIFARTMLIHGAPVRAGGIGSVASVPGVRGNGHASSVLRDAAACMRAEGMGIGFLFTGIPAFYERLGWHVVTEPFLVARADEALEIDAPGGYALRRAAAGDLPAMLRVYRRAIAGSTGAIVRTARNWRDTACWLEEDPAGCCVAARNGAVVAYIRSRERDYGYELLEAEHLAGHDAALRALLRRVARRALTFGGRLVATAPADSTLAAILRALPSTHEAEMPANPAVGRTYPMMLRVASLSALMRTVHPVLAARARENGGAPFSIRLHGPEAQSLVLDVGTGSARLRSHGAADFELNEEATLMSLAGQRRAGDLVVPPPSTAIGERVDALLPGVPLHFWNTDRI